MTNDSRQPISANLTASLAHPRDHGGNFDLTETERVTQKKYDGNGLGLVITKHICEMMGGTLRVESEPGNGSTFTVELPSQIAGRRTTGQSGVNMKNMHTGEPTLEGDQNVG